MVDWLCSIQVSQNYEAVQLLQLLQREKLSIEAAMWFIVRHS